MPQADMTRAELERYHPPLTRQPDFAAFWQRNLTANAAQPLDVIITPYPYPVERVSVAHVTYAGFGPNTRIAGWWIVPTAIDPALPTLVVYHGYSGSKGWPVDHLAWALQGCRVFAVDTRGQDGDTPDNAIYPSGSAIGHMTKGIADPETYYYKYAYLDCLRALTFVRAQTGVTTIALTGASQGGGLSIAVAALDRGADIVAVMPDVPFLCHFERALDMFSAGPYDELISYWRRHPETVTNDQRTLSYFDGTNLAPDITAPVLMSIGLLDDVCPPSTGYATFAHIAAPKELRVYPFNRHEGGGQIHTEAKFAFVRQTVSTR